MWHVWETGEVWWGEQREIDHLKDLGIDGRIILKWISKKWDWEAWTYWSGSGQGQMADDCKCGNELSDTIKCGEFPDGLKIC